MARVVAVLLLENYIFIRRSTENVGTTLNMIECDARKEVYGNPVRTLFL